MEERSVCPTRFVRFAHRRKDKLTVIYQKGKKRMVVKAFLRETSRVVVVLNTQFTNAPNTTQITSGAGRSSAAGNDAAIDSANTLQQQSVGAGGIARNRGVGEPEKSPVKMENGRTDSALPFLP